MASVCNAEKIMLVEAHGCWTFIYPQISQSILQYPKSKPSSINNISQYIKMGICSRLRAPSHSGCSLPSQQPTVSPQLYPAQTIIVLVS
jgi:hypothetical protein